MRQTHPGGERLFADYSGQTVSVVDEARMIELLVKQGYAVRMASERGGMKSLYKIGGRAVREVYLDGKLMGSKA